MHDDNILIRVLPPLGGHGGLGRPLSTRYNTTLVWLRFNLVSMCMCTCPRTPRTLPAWVPEQVARCLALRDGCCSVARGVWVAVVSLWMCSYVGMIGGIDMDVGHSARTIVWLLGCVDMWHVWARHMQALTFVCRCRFGDCKSQGSRVG